MQNTPLITFTKKLILISLPCFVLLGFSHTLLFFSGELASPDSFFKSPRHLNPTLVGLAYSNPVVYSKLTSILSEKPQIMSLGSSRVLAIRSEFFNPGVFYNGGSSIDILEDLNTLLERIPDSHSPRVILLGLDQNLLNSTYNRHPRQDMKKRYHSFQSAFEIYKQNWAIVLRDFLKKKFTLRQAVATSTHARKIGLNARANGEGFRQDGSYRYGRFLSNPHDPRYRDARLKISLDRVATGGSHFEFGKSAAEDLIREFTNFIAECKRRDIHVICFLPPYAHTVYEALKKSEKHNYIFQLESILKPLLDSYQFDFYDFSDLAQLGLEDDQALDGLHTTEIVYLRLLSAILRDNKILKSYMNEKKIHRLLQESKGQYAVIKD